MSRPTVLLFDIDGTLVATGGAGRRALELEPEWAARVTERLRDVSLSPWGEGRGEGSRG